MLTLYTWGTPNGHKVSILLEELGVDYRVKPVDIGRDEQFTPEFLRLSPNNKIPAILDEDGPSGPQSVFESGAILIYLADKYGRFLAPEGPVRVTTLEWLFWQVGGLGPMLGQLNYFARRAEETVPAAIARFAEESARLLGVMEKRLAAAPWLAGADYSIADIACYHWTLLARTTLRHDIPGDDYPAIDRWLETIGARPAVGRGMAVPRKEA